MTDDEVLPFNGGDAPDDAELKTRVAESYANTPAYDERMVARCVRMVIEKATGEWQVATAPSRRRWVFGAAAVAAAAIASITLRSKSSPTAPTTVASDAPIASTKPVDGGIQFDLRLPKGAANNVSVVGDFNGWDANATPMVKGSETGEWSTKIVLLPGRHIYAYVVNGEKWIVDPLAPQIPDAGYGPANALVVEGDSR